MTTAQIRRYTAYRSTSPVPALNRAKPGYYVEVAQYGRTPRQWVRQAGPLATEVEARAEADRLADVLHGDARIYEVRG